MQFFKPSAKFVLLFVICLFFKDYNLLDYFNDLNLIFRAVWHDTKFSIEFSTEIGLASVADIDTENENMF